MARTTERTLAPTLIALLAAGGAAHAAVPTQWTFKIVAIESNASNPAVNLPFGADLQGCDPAIDDAGNVAARWNAGGNTTDGIFYYNASTDTGSTIASGASIFGGGISLRGGRIAVPPAFDASPLEIKVLDAASGAVISTLPIGGPSGVTGSFSRVILDGDGNVAFRAATGSGPRWLLEGYQGATRTSKPYLNTDATYSFLGTPNFDGVSQFSGMINYVAGGPSTAAYVRVSPDGSGLQTTVIRAINGNDSFYRAVFNSSAVNTQGQVAYFVTRRSDNVIELRRGNGAGDDVLIAAGNAISPVDGTVPINNSEFANFGPCINNAGVVAFTPRRRDAGSGTVAESIWVGDGSDAGPLTTGLQRVIIHDDNIVTNLGTFQVGAGTGSLGDPRETITSNSIAINSRSQIVFVARLSDRRDALVIASPLLPTCGPSDVAGPNQSTTPDNVLTADDIIVFLGWFFANDARANVAGPDQSTVPDNALTADDIIVFLSRYFAGC